MSGKLLTELDSIVTLSDSNILPICEQDAVLKKVTLGSLNKNIVGNHLSNYVKSSPHTINLSLNNGTLTLKRGSVVYKADGTPVTVSADVSTKFTTTTVVDAIIVYNTVHNALEPYVQGVNIFSSATAPTTTVADTLWYDTTNTQLKITHDTGSTWTEIPLPICVASTIESKGYSVIKQVFNDFGYVGSTIFSLPDVVVEIPNGKTGNGELVNIEVTLSGVKTYTITGSSTTNYVVNLTQNGAFDILLANTYAESVSTPILTASRFLWYNLNLNKMFFTYNTTTDVWSENPCLGAIFRISTKNGSISSFIAKTPTTLTENSSNYTGTPHIIETYDGVNVWYRKYSDGWIEQGGVYSGSYTADGTYTINLLQPMRNTNYYYTALDQANGAGATNNWGTGAPYLSTRTTTNFLIVSDGIQFSTGMSWYVCGYAAN